MKMLQRRILLLLFFLNILNIEVDSQPVDLLNYHTYQLLINPANAGNNDYDWNIYNVYNSKKIISGNNFASLFLAGDFQLNLLQDKITLSGGIQRKTVYNSPINENLVYFSSAYHKTLQKHTFHIGLQSSLEFYELVSNEFLFPDQYDRNTGGYNIALPTNENFGYEKMRFLDLSFGVLYSYQFEKLKPEFGLSLFHVNKPTVSNLSNSEQLQMDMSIQFKNYYYYTNKLLFLPLLIYVTKQDFKQISIGTDVKYGLNRNTFFIRSLMAGFHFVSKSNEHPNSLVFNIGVNVNSLNIVLGYNNSITSTNKLPNSIQTFEISLIYNGFNSNIDKYSVPCEVF